MENRTGRRAEKFEYESAWSADICDSNGLPQPSLKACSACAGDYEDPDRTAWTPEGEADQEVYAQERGEESALDVVCEGTENDDEFPA